MWGVVYAGDRGAENQTSNILSLLIWSKFYMLHYLLLLKFCSIMIEIHTKFKERAFISIHTTWIPNSSQIKSVRGHRWKGDILDFFCGNEAVRMQWRNRSLALMQCVCVWVCARACAHSLLRFHLKKQRSLIKCGLRFPTTKSNPRDDRCK